MWSPTQQHRRGPLEATEAKPNGWGPTMCTLSGVGMKLGSPWQWRLREGEVGLRYKACLHAKTHGPRRKRKMAEAQTAEELMPMMVN